MLSAERGDALMQAGEEADVQRFDESAAKLEELLVAAKRPC